LDQLVKSNKGITEKGLQEAFTGLAFLGDATNLITFCFTTILDPPMKLQSLIKLTLLFTMSLLQSSSLASLLLIGR